MNRIIALVVGIVVVLFVASSMVFVVDQRHMAVLLSRDGGEGTLAGPGLHIKLPAPLQTLRLVDTRIQTFDPPDEDRYQSADQSDLLVNPVIKYRVSDPLKLVAETKGDTQSLPDRLALLLRSALGDAFAKYPVADALAKQQAIATEARDGMQKAAASLGVDVLAVQLTRIDFPAAMADSVYKRMIAGREQAAARERAEGKSEADQIKADADSKQQALIADAYRQAQTIKGDGDGNAASIAADAFGRDPQFYEFYQSMLAYRNSFKPNDVIVVDPSSEFFRFMRSPSGGASPDAAAASRKH